MFLLDLNIRFDSYLIFSEEILLSSSFPKVLYEKYVSSFSLPTELGELGERKPGKSERPFDPLGAVEPILELL